MAKLLSTWRTATVGDVVLRHFSGPSPTCEERTVRSAEEWGLLKTTAVRWEGWQPDAHKVPPRKYWGNRSIEVHAGDVLVTKAGPRHRVGVVVFVRVTQPQLMVSGKMVGLRPDPSVILPQLLSGILSTRGPQQHLERVKTGMAESQLNFSNSMLLATPLVFPQDLSEQRHIAVILDTVDEAIRQTEAMVEKLKKIKQGLLQDLLTRGIGKDGKLRPTPEQAPHLYKDSPLGKIPKEWEMRQVKETGTIVTGTTPSTACRSYYGGEVMFISPGDMTKEGDQILDTEARISRAGLAVCRPIPRNSICTVCIGSTIGKMGLSSATCATNQQINTLIPYEKAAVDFLYFSMALHLPPQLRRATGLQAVPIVNGAVFSRMQISIPADKNERYTIGEILVSASACISTEITSRNKLRLVKAGLLEDLLTGRVRVTDLPKDVEKMLDEFARRN